MFFLNDENPFITKISEDQKLFCAGELTKQECLQALKKMKNPQEIMDSQQNTTNFSSLM
jgi:hypothetical protein